MMKEGLNSGRVCEEKGERVRLRYDKDKGLISKSVLDNR